MSESKAETFLRDRGYGPYIKGLDENEIDGFAQQVAKDLYCVNCICNNCTCNPECKSENCFDSCVSEFKFNPYNKCPAQEE